jgi:hypothetical protein
VARLQGTYGVEGGSGNVSLWKLGLLREKENAFLGSFSWTQWTLKVNSGGHLEL